MDITNRNRVFRLLILYRWLSLLPAVVFVFLSYYRGDGEGRYVWVLLTAVTLNIIISTFFSQLNRALKKQPPLLFIEFILVALFIALSGGWQSPYYLYALNPLLAAAFFFQLRGAIIAVTVLSPLYLLAVFFDRQVYGGVVDWFATAVNIIGFYLISGTFGYAAVLLAQLRKTGAELQTVHQELKALHDLTVLLNGAADVAAVKEMVVTAVTNDLGCRRAIIELVEKPQSNLNSHFDREMIIPLCWGTKPIGVLLVEPAAHDIGGDTLRPALEAIAQQTAVTLGMMMTRQRRAKETAVQEERARIALDIHDSVSQSLFGAAFALSGSLKLLPDKPETAIPELERALTITETVRKEIRRTIHDIWPEEITAKAFETDLQKYINDVLQAHKLTIRFDIRGDFGALSARVRRSLYRISQEALTNIVHHAAADEASVCVDVVNHWATLSIRDNGRGFEPHAALSQEHGFEHFGLRGMVARTRSLGGSCDIFSRPGAGTSIVIDIPAYSEGQHE
ncbi:MAG: sensor histidine kinase [Chloroflexi bacterium]|nr:sensor histidine kinase [Chloroflexota bacterium]